MASTIVKPQWSFSGFDCQQYVGLKPSRSAKFSFLQAASRRQPSRRLFVVRASENHNDSIKKLGMTDAECEAAVVAGNVPEAPPVPPKPAAPAGTPVVPSLVSVQFNFFLELYECHGMEWLDYLLNSCCLLLLICFSS